MTMPRSRTSLLLLTRPWQTETNLLFPLKSESGPVFFLAQLGQEPCDYKSHGLKFVAEGRRRRTSLRDADVSHDGLICLLSRRDIQP